MSIAKGEIAILVFDALGLNDGLTEPLPGEVAYVMGVMERTVAQWEKKGIQLGYIYSDPVIGPDPSDPTGLADTDVDAVVNNIAVKSAPKFGRMASPDVKAMAHEGYALLFSVVLPTLEQHPYQPAGQGNCGGYMPIIEELTIPDDGSIDDITI
jgi:hypothetical protein